jgi:hypothetical protein
MANPWSILGLEPDTADEKQVRAAYARLLKVHRPDQDPEGFQQLRAAYQMALQWLERRATPEPDDWADDVVEEVQDEVLPVVADSSNPLPSSWAAGDVPVLPYHVDEQIPAKQPPPNKRPERDWPREWSYSLESLDRALKESPRHLDVIAMALRAFASDVVECRIPPVALECILSDAFDADMRLFGMSAPVTLLFCLLRGGCTGFVQSAMDALEKPDDQVHLTVLVQKLDDCLVDALSPTTVDIFFRAADMVALHKPFISKSIVRKLRRLLDDDSNSAKFDRLHESIMRGMALQDLVPEHRIFWSQRLEHPAVACDWKSPFPGQALAAVVILGKEWVGYPLMQGVVPTEVWRNAWKGRWFQLTVYRLLTMLQPRNCIIAGFAIVGGLFLIFGAHLSTKITPDYEPDPATQTEEYRRQYQRELELVKKYKEEKWKRTGTQ